MVAVAALPVRLDERKPQAVPIARTYQVCSCHSLIITYTISGVPYCNFCIMGPQNSILVIKAPPLYTLIDPLLRNPLKEPQSPILIIKVPILRYSDRRIEGFRV